MYYNTRGSKVGLKKIGPETAKISRNIYPSNSNRGSPSVSTTIVTSQASVDRRGAAVSSPRFAHTHCVYVVQCSHCHCNTLSTITMYIYVVLRAATMYNVRTDWRHTPYENNIVETIHSETSNQLNQGKQMSLEFPGIISLQIQVTTKDFKS